MSEFLLLIKIKKSPKQLRTSIAKVAFFIEHLRWSNGDNYVYNSTRQIGVYETERKWYGKKEKEGMEESIKRRKYTKREEFIEVKH